MRYLNCCCFALNNIFFFFRFALCFIVFCNNFSLYRSLIQIRTPYCSIGVVNSTVKKDTFNDSVHFPIDCDVLIRRFIVSLQELNGASNKIYIKSVVISKRCTCKNICPILPLNLSVTISPRSSCVDASKHCSLCADCIPFFFFHFFFISMDFVSLKMMVLFPFIFHFEINDFLFTYNGICYYLEEVNEGKKKLSHKFRSIFHLRSTNAKRNEKSMSHTALVF